MTATIEDARAALATLNAYFAAPAAPATPTPFLKVLPLAVLPKLVIPETIILPGERVANVRVQLAEPVPYQVSWKYGTTNDKIAYPGTLAQGGMYTAVSGTVTFLPGETEKVISVPILRDLPSGASIGFSVAGTQNNPPAGSAKGFIRQAATRADVAPLPQPTFAPAACQTGRKLVVSSNFMEQITADAVKGAWRSRPAWGRVQSGNGELGPNANAATDPGTNPHPIIDGKRVLRAEHVPVRDGGKTYDFSASMIMSQNLFSVRYGYLELRAKIDRAQGTAPAWWLMNANGVWNNGPEIDIFEIGLGDNPQYATTIHFDGDPRGTMEGTVVPFIPDGEFHVYGFDMTPEWLISTIDGKEVHRRRNPYTAIDWQVIINVAVGGISPAPKAPGAGWHSDMILDYLKVWLPT